jgi:hypothetical protein
VNIVDPIAAEETGYQRCTAAMYSPDVDTARTRMDAILADSV